MEFNVLDDLNSESSHENDCMDDSDKTVSTDTGEISNEEMDEQQSHELSEKVVLKARGKDHLEVLPEGWIETPQSSGMPIYMQKEKRVCTQAKPFFIGRQNVAKCQVPKSAIPCLHYRRELNKERDHVDVTEKAIEENSTQNKSEEGAKSEAILPIGSIETAQEDLKEKFIDDDELRGYCKILFGFETITVRRFKTRAGKRKHRERVKEMNRSTFPAGAKLLTFPLPPSSSGKDQHGSSKRAEIVMNITGKTHACILQEYIQRVIKVQPRYRFQELGSSSTPYGATVVINDMTYGSGCGNCKKNAKSAAAKATLEILIPNIRSLYSDDETQGIQQVSSCFDDVRIEDPRVTELCAQAMNNGGRGDTNPIKFEIQRFKRRATEFTMTVDKLVVKGVCDNKRDGKQKASQAILQAMHSPIISSWGQLLRLYGKGSRITLKKKKHEKPQITEVRPNQLILDKLKEEFSKLK